MDQPVSTATLKDVARAAGVSVSTASRALTGSQLISSATAEKVKACADQLAYRVNAQARGLRKSTTNSLGVIIPDITNPYFALLAASIESAAAEAGYVTMLGNSSDNADRLAASVRLLMDHRVDGFIVVPLPGTEAVFNDLKRKSIPCVFVDRDLPDIDAWSVTSDPRQGITAAVTHLYEKGWREIGFLSGPPEISSGAERLAAFTNACERAGISRCPIVKGTFQQNSGYEGARALYVQGVRAMITGDFMMTLGALSAFYDADIDVGKDVALIGFDNMPTFRLQPRPLSVIDQHVEQMGRQAFELLYRQMSSDITFEELTQSRRERIQADLIVRKQSRNPEGIQPPKTEQSEA